LSLVVRMKRPESGANGFVYAGHAQVKGLYMYVVLQKVAAAIWCVGDRYVSRRTFRVLGKKVKQLNSGHDNCRWDILILIQSTIARGV